MSDAEFHEAFHRHKDSIYRFAYRMTGSDQAAQDIVQECFLALWRKPASYNSDRGALRTFLLGMARHSIFRQWRKSRLEEPLDDEHFACGPLDVIGQERDQTVAKAVQLLPPLQREALILAEYEEMSLHEIARTVDAELAAVKSRLHRARENLRRMLAPLLKGQNAVYGNER